ncbi:MAG: hypothetical protein J2P21_22625 [Chloracidobacterium sp.]|nr:hypothetical protein [Chloracidobacterium sp.]
MADGRRIPRALRERAINADFHGRKSINYFGVFQFLYWYYPQPGNLLIWLVESCFLQDRIVTAFVKMHDNQILLNLDCAACLQEFAIELFGRSIFTSQVFGEPTIATVGQINQCRIQNNIEPNFAGQTIEVKELTLIPSASSTRLRPASPTAQSSSR